jgi:hypothetical protein
MDPNPSSNRLVVKEYPLFQWLFSAAFFIIGLTMLFRADGLLMGGICCLVSVAMVLFFAPVVTITIDKTTGLFTVQTSHPLRTRLTEVPIAEVSSLDMERTRSSRGGSVYRIAMVKTSGERIPLQALYSSGYAGKAKKARRISEFLGLPDFENQTGNLFKAAVQMQAAASQVMDQQNGVTSGVTWTLTTSSMGGRMVTRWSSRDFSWPGNFLLFAQQPRGSSGIFGGGGILGGVMQMIYKQVIAMYGIQPEDTPGLEHASPLAPPEPRLEHDFTTLTSDPHAGRALLNQWVVQPLERWAARYPMKTVQTGDQVGQLVVLLSPGGTTVSVMGLLPASGAAEVIDLGVDLVRALPKGGI